VVCDGEYAVQVKWLINAFAAHAECMGCCSMMHDAVKVNPVPGAVAQHVRPVHQDKAQLRPALLFVMVRCWFQGQHWEIQVCSTCRLYEVVQHDA
jgi:hypothetical protein